MTSIYCPKCGAVEQSHESYCRSCGEWLPNLEHIGRSSLLPTTSRSERVRRIRGLELISIGMSLSTAFIVFLFLMGLLNRNLLFMVVALAIVISVYQLANMYLGQKVAKSLPKKPEIEGRTAAGPETGNEVAPTKRLSSPAGVGSAEEQVESRQVGAHDRTKQT